MGSVKPENQIDYIELPALDIAKTKAFYDSVFGWTFTDYGPDYTSFHDGRMAGGFAKDTTPFSEFLWADFFRRKIKRKAVEADFSAAMERALG